jgi:GNAT superfamily N-acetyltransferase
MKWVEDNPNEAVKWAIGTPDKPGYLGLAIRAGIDKGLSGADLATYAQQHGQVSVSPERAGQNWTALFGPNGTGSFTSGGGTTYNTGSKTNSTPDISIEQMAKDFHSKLDQGLNAVGQAKDNVATSLSDIADKFHTGLDAALSGSSQPVNTPGNGFDPSHMAPAVAPGEDIPLKSMDTPLPAGDILAQSARNLAGTADEVAMGKYSVLNEAKKMNDLANKYPSNVPGLPDFDAMSPEDTDAYNAASMAVGGMSSPVKGKLAVSAGAAEVAPIVTLLAKYGPEERAGVEDFIKTQTAAGREPAKINDFVSKWMEANPPVGAVVAESAGVVDQMGGGAQRLRQAAKERAQAIIPEEAPPVSRTAPEPAVESVPAPARAVSAAKVPRANVSDSEAPDLGKMIESLRSPDGKPGISIEPTYMRAGDVEIPEIGQNIVFRDAQGKPAGILEVILDEHGQPNVMQVAVRPDMQRQGIATALYDAAKQSGLNVDAASGSGGYTEAGAALARARQTRPTVPLPAVESVPAPARALQRTAPAPAAEALADALPAGLTKASPRYSIGPNQFKLEFASDIDKALFIVAQKVPSKADAKFMEFLRERFPSHSDEELRAMGAGVRSEIKTAALAGDPKLPLQIQASETVARARQPLTVEPPAAMPPVAAEVAPPAAIAAPPAVAPVIPVEKVPAPVAAAATSSPEMVKVAQTVLDNPGASPANRAWAQKIVDQAPKTAAPSTAEAGKFAEGVMPVPGRSRSYGEIFDGEAPPAQTWDAEGNLVTGAEPTPGRLSDAAIDNFADLQEAVAPLQKKPFSPGATAWNVLSEAKKTLFSLSNFHVGTVAQDMLYGPAGPKGALDFIASYAKGLIKPGGTAARATGELGEWFQKAEANGLLKNVGANPETGEVAKSAFNPLTRIGIQAGGSGLTSGSAAYGAAKASGASDEDALKAGLVSGGIAAVLGPTVAQRMHNSLWTEAVPLAKVLTFKAAVKGGASETEAAMFVKNLLGGQNLEAIAGSTGAKIARLVVMAPDWLLSQTKLIRDAGIGAAKSVPGVENLPKMGGKMTGSQQLSRDWMLKAVGTGLFATEALQIAFTGHTTKDNSPGHFFELEVPDGKGGNTTVSLFPGNIAGELDLLSNRDPGRFAENRLGVAGTAGNIVANQQYPGSYAPIYPKDAEFPEQARDVAGYAAGRYASMGLTSPVQQNKQGVPLPLTVASLLAGLKVGHNTHPQSAPSPARGRTAPVPARSTAPARVAVPARR